jgi:hypothetical protein
VPLPKAAEPAKPPPSLVGLVRREGSVQPPPWGGPAHGETLPFLVRLVRRKGSVQPPPEGGRSRGSFPAPPHPQGGGVSHHNVTPPAGGGVPNPISPGVHSPHPAPRGVGVSPYFPLSLGRASPSPGQPSAQGKGWSNPLSRGAVCRQNLLFSGRTSAQRRVGATHPRVGSFQGFIPRTPTPCGGGVSSFCDSSRGGGVPNPSPSGETFPALASLVRRVESVQPTLGWGQIRGSFPAPPPRWRGCFSIL